MTRYNIIALILVGLTLLVTTAKAIDDIGSIHAVQPIEPIKPATDINLAQAELGKKLFFDPRLSKSGGISCNSCHNLSMGGSNQLETFIGPNWVKLDAPVFNSKNPCI